MKIVILISAICFSLAVGAADGKKLSKDPEVAAFQKLEQLVAKQMATGVTSRESLLKARILEVRALFANEECGHEEWLPIEKNLNSELLQLQSHRVSQGEDTLDKVFEFQNTLLSTRKVLKRVAGAPKSPKDKSMRFSGKIPVSNDPEVAAIQKLGKLVDKLTVKGDAPKESELKAEILEVRALFANGELGAGWLAIEKYLNSRVLELQSHRVSQGEDTLDKVFEFQNTLLSTRELLKINAGAQNSPKVKSGH